MVRIIQVIIISICSLIFSVDAQHIKNMYTPDRYNQLSEKTSPQDESESDYEYTPLDILFQEQDFISSFLMYRVDVEAIDEYGKTPLHYAAEYGFTTMVEDMIYKGAVINAEDQRGRTPLHEAVIHGFISTVVAIVYAEADINARDRVGLTPLHLATLYRYEKIIDILVNNGADVNAKDSYGKTPHEYASEHYQKHDYFLNLFR